jgi:hypothetical protein
MRRVTLATLSILCGTALSACAARSVDAPPRSSVESSRDHAPVIDWDRPMGTEGLQIPDADAAKDLLAFSPMVPSDSLGAPTAVWLSNPSFEALQGREIIFVYDHPKYGQFFVEEQVSQTTQAHLEALAVCDHASGCEGKWTLIDLQNKSKGVLVEGPRYTGLIWLSGGIRVNALGPSGSFTGSDAIAVANSV